MSVVRCVGCRGFRTPSQRPSADLRAAPGRAARSVVLVPRRHPAPAARGPPARGPLRPRRALGPEPAPARSALPPKSAAGSNPGRSASTRRNTAWIALVPGSHEPALSPDGLGSVPAHSPPGCARTAAPPAPDPPPTCTRPRGCCRSPACRGDRHPAPGPRGVPRGPGRSARRRRGLGEQVVTLARAAHHVTRTTRAGSRTLRRRYAPPVS